MHKDKASLAYFISSLGPGGAEGQLVELVKSLDRNQYNVRVLIYRPDSFFRPQLAALGVPVHYQPRRFKLDLGPVRVLSKWLSSGEVDLVHAFLDVPSFYGALAHCLAGKGKFVASERSVATHRSLLFWMLKSWAHRRADVTIANSEAGQKLVMQRAHLDGDRVIYIPNGVDMVRFAPVEKARRCAVRAGFDLGPDDLVFLTVGSFSPLKNHFGILDAMCSIPVPSNWRFWWIGQHSKLGERLRARILKKGLDRLVRTFPPVQRIEDYYSACDILVLNSLQEGTPNVVLEAMACGRPVVATDVSDMRKYVLPGKTGWMVPPGNPTALRSALQEVASCSREQLEAMGLAGRQHLMDLGMDTATMARRHEQVYARLLGIPLSTDSTSIC